VGIAGAGWVSPHHLEAWGRLRERATVVAIADPDPGAARDRAAAFGVPATYPSVEAMLVAEPLDAIDIATPRETHVPICRLAAAHGLAILCQKPLAPTLEEAEALVADLDTSVRLMVHENWRFRPHYRQIREWLLAGHVGEVRTVTMALRTSGLLPDAHGRLPALDRQPMLATLDRLLLMEVMIHHVDTLRFLLGPLTLRGAQLGQSCAAVRGEDRASLLLTTARGAAVSLIGDFMADGYPPEQFDRLEILGTGGVILLDGGRLLLRGHATADLTIDLAANYKASYAGVMTHYLDRLADGGLFETGPADNLETLRIIEGAYLWGSLKDKV
jgi:predicted dehydrogenase